MSHATRRRRVPRPWQVAKDAIASHPSAAVMSTPTKYLGVTPPISLSGPTEKDVEITNALEAALRANNVFESSEEAKLRYVLTDAYH